MPGSALDGTLLEDIAERGEDILKCAGMLFAGYVDGATTFAEGHGGGGGGSDPALGTERRRGRPALGAALPLPCGENDASGRRKICKTQMK